MPYSTILWDFDGTIANTLDCALGIFNEMADRYGFLPITDTDEVRKLTTRTFIQRYNLPLRRIPALAREYLATQRQMMDTVALMPGISELLAQVRERGYRTGIVSSNSPDNIRACLQAREIEHHFDFLVGSSRIFGKSRTIRRVLRKSATPASEVLYVGDEIRDIDAAHGAGVDVAAVCWGFNTKDILEGGSPTYLMDEPSELVALLDADKRRPSLAAGA